MIERHFAIVREEVDFIFDNYNSSVVMKMIWGTGDCSEDVISHKSFMPLFGFMRACVLKGEDLYIGNIQITEKEFYSTLKRLRNFIVASFDKTDCSWIPLLGDEHNYRVVMKKSNGEIYYVSTYKGNIPFARNLDDGIGPDESFITDEYGDKIKDADGNYVIKKL